MDYLLQIKTKALHKDFSICSAKVTMAIQFYSPNSSLW